MKQTKLLEPILYTILWSICAIITIIIMNGYINFVGLNYFLSIILVLLFIFIVIYNFVGIFIALFKRQERYETRDMKKYILGKIKFIDQQIAELQEKKEYLLSFYENK